jgi:hypothetical protein
MTNTKLTYDSLAPIDYDSLSFNPDEPEPLPDAMFQYPIFEEILHLLGTHLTDLYSPEEVFRSSNTFICYDPTDLNVRVGPDYYFAAGIDAQAIENTKLYLPWAVGKPPDFVLEIASESTAKNDIINKRRIYAEIGVPEYWRFDRSGGDFYGEPLAGDILKNGIYRPVNLSAEPDGVLKGYSPALRRSLCWQDGMLVFYDPETNQYMRNLRAERVRADAAQTAKEQAETRLAALEAELRKLRGE